MSQNEAVRCPHHPDRQQARSVLFEVIEGRLEPVVLFDSCRDRVTGLVDPVDFLPPTVAKVRAALEGMPGDAYVVQARDSEGNRFSPFAEAEVGHYLPDSAWQGEVVDESEPGALKAVVLWPVS